MGIGYFDIVDAVSVILIIISCTILIPILVYYLHKFHQIADTQFIKHRQPHIIYWINTLTIFCFLTERIFAIFAEIIYYQEHTLPIWTVAIGDNFTVLMVYVLCAIRTWLLYYNRKYHTKIVENVWKNEINPNQISWFIRNKHKYGSFKYIFMRIAFIPSILFLFFEISVDIIFGHAGIHDQILNIFLPVTIYITCFILYYKISDFYDSFNVRKEIYYECVTLCTAMCIEIFSVIMFFIIDAIHKHTDTHYLERLEWLFAAIITYITLFVLCLISTAYPVYLYTKTNQLKKEEVSSTPKSSMLEVISTRDGYKKFITHLVNHFATENLLFVTELIQIKHNFQVKHNNIITCVPKNSDLQMLTETEFTYFSEDTCVTIDFNEENKENTENNENTLCVGGGLKTGVTFSCIFDSNDHLVCKINLPLKLPHSQILEKYNNFIDQMDCLFNKYVNVNSEYEINISSDARKLLINIYKNIKNIKCKENYLFNSMDDA
eukprot:85871_1